jgi:DNA-binding MarR family transcriptional regulator
VYASVVTDRHSKSALAADAWRAILDFIIGTAPQRARVLAEFGLTPNDSRALSSLDPRTGRAMRSLAAEWGCDASTATWIVDRLEARGLAERRPHETDRRVKLVLLTPEGDRLRDEVTAGMYTPPPELLELDTADLATLRAAATKLPAVPQANLGPSGARRGSLGR